MPPVVRLRQARVAPCVPMAVCSGTVPPSDAVPCVAHRTALGALVKDGDQFARLAQVGTRYVLLRSSERAGVVVKLVEGTAAPVQVEVPMDAIPDVVPGLSGTMVATVRRDGTAVVIEAATR